MQRVKYHVKSPTGCVHLSEDTQGGIDLRNAEDIIRYRTICNYVGKFCLRNSAYYYHFWETTSDPVTCKKCLRLMRDRAQAADFSSRFPNEDRDSLSFSTPPKTKVVISILGGVLSEVHSTDPNMEIVLYDFDDIESLPATIKQKEKEYQDEIRDLTQVA